MLECAAGYYYNVYVGYYEGDGISRVANAFYVLYSRNPHLGAIGFVWNPLPSMVDLVFLLLYPWIPAMAAKGIAGLLMSAIFASLTVSVLAKAFIERGLPRWYAVVFPLLFSLNPMVFIYGFNGLSEAPFIFFVVLCIKSFLNWLDEHQIGDLVVTSFALALAFWCRYEAVPFGFSMATVFIMATMLFNVNPTPPNEKPFSYKWSRMEGTLAVLVSPLFYSIVLWILLNTIIMNNPLNFLNGEYTTKSQMQALSSNALYAAMIHDPVKAGFFALKKVMVFSLPLLSILILRILNRRFFQWETLMLIVIFVSIPLLQIVMLVGGTTYAFLRYFIFVLPVSLAWLPYELSKIKRKWLVIIPLIAMLLNYGILSYIITQPTIAPMENIFIQNTFGNHEQTYYDEKRNIEIARYLDENYPQSNILVDSSSAFLIIIESKFPKRFYINSDYYFNNAVLEPKKYEVDYILIPKPGSVSAISAINAAYPNLYDKGSDWAVLTKDFGTKWRLYELIK